MGTAISEYYSGELIEWKQLIGFCFREILEFENKLEEVIRRNSIPAIAEQVEGKLEKLKWVTEKFSRLKMQCQQQETALRSNSKLIDDKLITDKTEKQQIVLRSEMQQAEKDYIDIKYECYNFLSGTLKK